MPRRLVFDSNVWLDWLVFEDAALTALRADIAAGDATVVIDAPCLEELSRVLAYPLQRWTLNATGIEHALARCRQLATLVDTPPAAQLPRCADADDQKFLELAAAHSAFALITRDRELLRMSRPRHALPFHIVTPAAYAALPRVESP